MVKEAEMEFNDLMHDENWRTTFNDSGKSRICLLLEDHSRIEFLQQKIKVLLESLGQQRLLFVIDEASRLFYKEKPDDNLVPQLNRSRYHAMARIISCLKTLPLWFIFISTESPESVILSHRKDTASDYHDNPSAREIPESPQDELELPKPFIALPFDVRVQVDPKASLRSFSSISHMAEYGRPLWKAYDGDGALEIAKVKLLQGNAANYGGGKKLMASFNPNKPEWVSRCWHSACC